MHHNIRSKTTLIFTFIILFLNVFIAPSHAQDNKEFVTSLAHIPILHEGRIKPLESFARAQLKQFSGHDKNALIWLTQTLFNPALQEQARVLKIRTPDVINLLGLDNRKGRTYAYNEVTNALATKQDTILSILKTTESEWTPAQKNLIVLQKNTVALGDILASLSLFLPLSVDIPKLYLPQNLETPPTYMAFVNAQKTIEDDLKSIISNKGLLIESYSEDEQKLTRLSYALSNLRRQGERSHILRVLPPFDGSADFYTPWDYVLSGKSHPANKTLFEQWQALSQAYHSGNLHTFETIAADITHATITRANINATKLNAEVLYNRAAPFKISCLLYAFALMLLTAGQLLFTRRRDILTHLSALTLIAGVIVHIAGIAMRVYILSRPPVSTLYESILFVGVIATAYGVYGHMKHRGALWLYVAAICGVILHMLGFAHDQDGDNLMMLTAVLNTNFWLATHVTIITAGYAFCLLTSLFAHVCLFDCARRNAQKPEKTLWEKTWVCALLALLLTAVGTILGGIWADQSWGRFWGWDPKENGALLIVLWLIWVIHGKIAGQFNHIWTAAGLAYLCVIVALSWFGVNLLSVGLHAYGFTDSAAWSLGLFTAAQTLFIGGLVTVINRKNKHAI